MIAVPRSNFEVRERSTGKFVLFARLVILKVLNELFYCGIDYARSAVTTSNRSPPIWITMIFAFYRARARNGPTNLPAYSNAPHGFRPNQLK